MSSESFVKTKKERKGPRKISERKPHLREKEKKHAEKESEEIREAGRQ